MPAASESSAPEITQLLRAIEAGDRAASDRLFERVYGELRKIARRQLRAVPQAARYGGGTGEKPQPPDASGGSKPLAKT